MIWLDIETNPSSACTWSGHSGASNCQYIGELVSAIQAHGKQPGIYASLHMWEEILGSASACKDYAHIPLWYAHYDNVANFDDWSTHKFGGWTKPHIKQYKGTSTFCSAGVDFSFY